MATHVCPECGSAKATTVMLPSATGSKDSRPHPAFRCLVCDTQWTTADQQASGRADPAPAAPDGQAPQAPQAPRAQQAPQAPAAPAAPAAG